MHNDMSNQWGRITIRDLADNKEAEIKTGPFGTQLHASDYVSQGTPVINARNIGFGDIRDEKLEYISDETVRRLSSHLLKTGDIVFGRKGTVERHSFIKEKQENWFQGTDCMRLRIKSNRIDSRFVSYCLLTDSHKQWIINQSSHGATMTSLNQDIIGRISLPYPPKHIQQRIVDILSAYDDLVENNTRRIRVLEEMAQVIYREWFVHFRYPGHEGARLVESAVGEVPEGWEVVAFTDFADVLSGGTPKTSVPEYWDGNIPWFTPQDLSSSFFALNTVRKITELGLRKCNSKLYPQHTVFITARGTVGKCVLTSTPMAMSQTNYALIAKDGYSQFFLYLLTLSCVDRLKQQATGAVFDTIIVDTFRKLSIIKPTIDIVDAFHAQVSPIFGLIENLLRKNQNLRQQRDLLLPRLVSGELPTDFETDFTD